MFSKKKKQTNLTEGLFLRRKQLLLPIKVTTLLNFFEIILVADKNKENLFKQNCQLFQISVEHQQSYKNKTRQQQIIYYDDCLCYLEQYIKDKKSWNNLMLDVNTQNLQFRGFYKASNKLITKWQEKNIKIDMKLKQLEIFSQKSSKHNFKINLQNYYMRQSQDNSKKALVLEAIIQNSEYPIIRLAFQNQNYQQIKNILYSLCLKSQICRFIKQITNKSDSIQKSDHQKFHLDMHNSNQSSKIKSKQFLENKNSYVSKQIINDYEMFVEKFIKNNILEHDFNMIISQSHRKIYENNNVFILEQLIFLDKQSINYLLNMPKEKWNKHIKQFVVIEKIQQKNIQVIYERFNFKQLDLQNFYLKGFYKNKSISKGILICQNHNSKKFQLIYQYIEVNSLSQEASKLIVQIKVNTDHKRDFALEYFRQFSNLTQIQINENSPKNMNLSNQEKFYTILNQFDQIQIYHRFGSEQIIVEQDQNERRCDQKYQNQNKQQNYLNHKHQLNCGVEGTAKKITKHYLFQDWKRLKSGGVLCVNEKIITQQKKLGKYVLNTIRKNLFKGKSILNISLPVAIFKKQSHLQTIARNFSFAPILLQKAKNLLPLEKLKYIITFTITVAALGVCMEKPFNPLIGQTYQGRIDNCPVFLEQISHHPPISAYYFEGRGYKAYGQINSKIDLGMNSVRGYSDKQNLLVFDNGDRITYSILKLVIKGLFFGDRQFNFQDKNYIYDMSNDLFAQLYFDKKSSYFSSNQDASDLFIGKIKKVTPNFKEYFKQNNRKKFPENTHIIQQICQFEGIWNDYISFNGVKFFDFKLELPYEMENQKFSLLSDSAFRLDIQKLIQGNVQQSQRQKEKIQQQQRRDRKLRQNKRQSLKQ